MLGDPGAGEAPPPCVVMSSGQPEWRLAILIGFAGVDLVPFQKQFHHSRVPFPGSSPKWCSAAVL